MNNQKTKNKSGFIKSIILIVGGLVLLKYMFNIDVIDYLTQGKFRDLLDKLHSLGSKGWEKYKDLFLMGWNNALELINKVISILNK